MLNPNELAVWICLAVIVGAPFFFKTWLDHKRPVLADEVQKKTSLLSTLIFVALFTGGFAFREASSSMGGALLFAAVISFSILFQIAGRYQLSMNRARPVSLVSHQASLRQTAGRFAVGAAITAILAQWNLAIFFVPFAIPFLMPLFLRLQHRCSPMAESELKNSILDSFRHEGVLLSQVLIVDDPNSSVKNAFLAGTGFGVGAFGRTLFITLPLIESLNDDELRAVLLHEAAHLKQNHTSKRIFSAVGLMVLSAFWVVLPAVYLFHSQPVVVLLSIPVSVLLQAFLFSRVVSRQEHEADLAAVAMGASSDALVSALEKTVQGIHEQKNSFLRILNGNLYPVLSERVGAIRSCEVPARFLRSRRSFALAYSLLVTGVVFWAANHSADPAKVSRSEETVAIR